MNDRGNGIYVWNAPGLLVEGNDIRALRARWHIRQYKQAATCSGTTRSRTCGLPSTTCTPTEGEIVRGNRSIGNHVGYALMYLKTP